MRLPLIVCLTMLAGFTTANAEMLEIELPGAEAVETTSVRYQCGDSEIAVTYYNTDGNALAVLAMGEETVITANVMAASGAKYAGGPYIWWTKGDSGDLYDLMKGEGAEPLSCAAVE